MLEVNVAHHFVKSQHAADTQVNFCVENPVYTHVLLMFVRSDDTSIKKFENQLVFYEACSCRAQRLAPRGLRFERQNIGNGRTEPFRQM